MVAKVLLPIYGGTPAVWTVCMLFFQLLLLISYGYVWLLSQLRGLWTWRVVHLVIALLSLGLLPLTFVPEAHPGVPEFIILKNLLMQLGLPLLVVGASAPLLQFAFSQTKDKRATDPYFLYVASNVGSLLALVSYPWLVERYSGVMQQFNGWNITYLLYLGLLFSLLFMVQYTPLKKKSESGSIIHWNQRLLWVFLSFIPCSLMLGVTFYISTDVAATPLLWVLPLALYLLSFIITFAKRPIISHDWVVRNVLFFIVFIVLGFIIGPAKIPVVTLIIANLMGFFMLALLCHGELIGRRPELHQLTTFYFCLALGGLLAGVFNGLLAPRIFSHAYEYPFVILLSLLCIPKLNRSKGLSGQWLITGVILLLLVSYFLPVSHGLGWIRDYHVAKILALALIVVWSDSKRSLFFGMSILFMFVLMPWFKSSEILSQQRNFYGIKQVVNQSNAHVLLSQSTLHGFQVEMNPKPSHGARAYYAPVFPVVKHLQTRHSPLHAMVLGLGTGIMACQFREQDQLKMVEIDEQVIDIASNPKLFTYLRDCPSHPLIIKKDGLLAVSEVTDASNELLVMDAFSSDAIPVHFLTLEAFKLYQKKMTVDGAILVNITNRHLNVLPVITAAARALDMIILHKSQVKNESLGQFDSQWVLLTMNDQLAGKFLNEQGWRFVADADTQLWTNDYSNLIPLLK
jgi:hypothetical protein